jgi:hypothetical protein
VRGGRLAGTFRPWQRRAIWLRRVGGGEHHHASRWCRALGWSRPPSGGAGLGGYLPLRLDRLRLDRLPLGWDRRGNRDGARASASARIRSTAPGSANWAAPSPSTK